MRTFIYKAGYGRWRIGNTLMQSLTLKYLFSVSLPLFERFQGDAFVRPFLHANLKDRGFRITASTNMELFNQVILCLDILERKTIVLVAEARVLYGV